MVALVALAPYVIFSVMTRKPIPKETETKVLLASRRRCAFHFALEGDLSVKKGQITHVDHDPSNSRFENLAYLCFDHHNEYDSKTSQSKGLTEAELIRYRDQLYEYMKQIPFSWPDPSLQEANLSGEEYHRISLELYDRRIKTYYAARNFITSILQSASVKWEDISNFTIATEEALFLFGESIAQYFTELRDKAAKYNALEQVLQSEPVGSRRTSLVDRKQEILLWFLPQIDELRRRMRPYLTVGYDELQNL